jgi:hypothetical protein
MGRQKSLNRMVACIPRIKSALNFFMNAVLICSQIFEIRHIFIVFISNQYILILPCILIARYSIFK